MARQYRSERPKAPPSSQPNPPSRDVGALLALLNARALMPHAWGRNRNDCVGFVAAAVKAQTGRDPARGHQWATERGAIRALHTVAAKAKGGKVPLAKCIETVLDARFERIAPAMAQRGDIAGVPPEAAGADPRFGLHPMIVEGETLCSPGQRKLMRLPRAAMITAWRVSL